MKNKMFKKFGAMIMALVLILTSIGSMSTSFAKSDYFDPDDLNWEFPYRCQDDAIEFEAFKNPITVEAESRNLEPIIKSKELQEIARTTVVLIKIKVYNEQAGNRIIYFPYTTHQSMRRWLDEDRQLRKSYSLTFINSSPHTFFYGDKIDVSYTLSKGQIVDNEEKQFLMNESNFPFCPIEVVGRGIKISSYYFNTYFKTYSPPNRPGWNCRSNFSIINTTSKKINLSYYRGTTKLSSPVDFSGKAIETSLEPGGACSVLLLPANEQNMELEPVILSKYANYIFNKIVINNANTGFIGEVREAKKEFPNEAPSDEEKAKALAKAKEDAKTEIKTIKDLTAEQIAEYEKKVDEATSDEAVKAIIEEAKKQAETNKASEEEKAQALTKAKEDAKTEIKAIKDLTAEQIAELEKKVDEATSDEAVKAIVEEAKKQAETNKASNEKKAKEEALRKAREEELAKAKEEALKKAKEEELAKELAKKNENDPVYQKNKLSKLLEEAKRLRHPSEELEAAIDEAYDILLDKYARLEDYKYAIEKIERILQNRRDTRRNRFKLDVDDINETDTELTGKTGAKWYVDIYNGKKCILSGQANYKGDFSIEIKKGKIKAKDKLKVVATDPQDDKKYKEVEIEVLGSSKNNTDSKSITTIDDLLQADGTSEENALSDLSIFPVGKNYYNVVQNNQKTTVYMDVNTYINGNCTMLPIRYIAYALGFNVEYDNYAREAIFSNRENSVLAKKVVRVNIDTGLMRDADGRVYSSDVRPVLINNRIHASIANIARMFEASQGTIEDGVNQTIEWDNARKAVYVFKNVK